MNDNSFTVLQGMMEIVDEGIGDMEMHTPRLGCDK